MFKQAVKEFLLNELVEMDTQTIEENKQDLAYILTLNINMTGSIDCSSYKARQNVAAYYMEYSQFYREAAEYVNHNIHSNPEGYEVELMINASYILLERFEYDEEKGNIFEQVNQYIMEY